MTQLSDSERAAVAVVKCLVSISPLIEARRPLPWRPKERNPQRVIKAATEAIGHLREDFAQLEQCRGAARRELLESRKTMLAAGVRQPPVDALGITGMFALDVACEKITEAVEVVEQIVAVADLPNVQSSNNRILFRADQLPDYKAKEWKRFLPLLEVEARDAAAAKPEQGEGNGGAVDHQHLSQPAMIVNNYHNHSVKILGNVQGSNVAADGSSIAGSSASYNNIAVKLFLNLKSGLATLFTWIWRFIGWLWAWL